MDDLTNLHLEGVSPELISRYRELLAEKDRRAREAAVNAPPRPRPWHTEARPDQLPPGGDWNIWLILSGRGWGKAERALRGSLNKRLATRKQSGRS